jgi:Zn-dependent protease/CBS domain-containing protein
VRVGKIFGIEITVNLSWIFIFALVAYSIGDPAGPLRGAILTPLERVTIGVVASLLFFASVLFHELAHSLLARSRGVPVKGITLFIFGGVSQLDGEPSNAPSEAWISAIGPLASLFLAVLFYALALLARPPSAVALMFGYLAFANAALAVFNILPAYPLDGGRVLHALVWRTTKDRLRATRIAARIGGAIALVLIAGGIAETLLLGAGVSGLWMTFIGWFLLNAGNAERRQSELTSSLRGHAAGDLLASPMLSVGADETGERVLQAMRTSHVRVFSVHLGESFIGFVTVEDMAKVAGEELPRTFVTALMTRIDDAERVPATDDANDVVRRLATGGLEALVVNGADGEPVGLITRESIMRWLSTHLAGEGPAPGATAYTAP